MLWLDLRYSLRVVLRHRTWAAGAVATIALVVGVSTGMFAAIYGLLLRPYPFPHADRLVMLWESNRDTGVRHLAVTESAYPIYRKDLSNLATLAHFIPSDPGFPVSLADSRRAITFVRAAPELFSVLGVSPLFGRTFTDAEGVFPAEDVAVLSYRFWMAHFSGRREVVGTKLRLRLAGRLESFTIVGVMPLTFEFPHPLYPGRPDVWASTQRVPGRFRPGNNFYTLALLKPSSTLAAVQTAVKRIAERIGRDEPRWYGAISVDTVPLSRESLKDSAAIVVALSAAFLLVTLIGCTNLVHLLMARVIARRRDVAVRLALGAGRADLLRLTGLELGILLLVGSALGFFVAYAGLRALPAALPAGLYIPRADSLLSDPAVVLATVGAWTAIGVVLTASMWTMVRRNEGGQTLTRGGDVFAEGRVGFRGCGRVLLICEVALAFALTTTALSMFHHLRTLLNEDAGMDPKRLLAVDVFFPPDALKAAIPALQSFVGVVAAGRDVKEVALVDGFPLSGFPVDVMATGVDGPISRTWQPSELHVVTPSFGSVVGLTVLHGRWIGREDMRTARRVAVINEAMALHYFRGANPVGRRLRSGRRDLGTEWDVVGVVRESKRIGTRTDAGPAIFLPWAQVPIANVSVVVRTGGDARRVAAFVRDQALLMAPGAVEVRKIRTGSDIVTDAAARSRFVGRQLLGVAALALLLASTGVYSIVWFGNSLRRREMAVRMAVGSVRSRVAALVVRETMVLVGLGIVAGLPLSVALQQLLNAVREGGGPAPGIAYLTTVMIFCVVAIAASLPSACRAASVEPAIVLRSDQ